MKDKLKKYLNMTTVTIISFVLGIAGIIATYLFAKWQMRRKKIVHFSINSYDIGKGLSDDFPEFKLYYNGETLPNNVGVLKGGFINVGGKDICGFKGDYDIRLILPEILSVKAVVISRKTEGLVVVATEDKEQKNIINFGINELFKTDEYFIYTVITESPIDIEDIKEMPRVYHRISDTDIHQMRLGVHREFLRRKMLRWNKAMVALIFFLGLLMIPLSMFNNVKTKYINKSTGEEVKMVIDRKSNIHVCEHVFIPFIFEGKTLTQEELESELTIVPITTFKLFNFRTLFAWGAWLFAILYFACTYYFLFTKYLGGDNRHIIDIVYPPQKKQKKK